MKRRLWKDSRMRYITSEHPEHPDVWVIGETEDGTVLEVLPDATYDRAVAVLASGYDWEASLTAAGAAAATWEADPAIAYEGLATSDKRQLEHGSVYSRQLPQPLMWNFTTTQGHQGAAIAGAVDQFERRENGALWAAGRFDTGEAGVEAQRLVADDIMRGVSIDLAAHDVETDVLAMDEGGFPTDWLDRYTSAEFAGLTGTPKPAFADARIKMQQPVQGMMDCPSCGDSIPADSTTCPDCGASLAVAAAGGPLDPPADWFTDPLLTAPTPLTFTDDGRVFGHIATWGTCHIGQSGACISPPRSGASYSYFTTGAVRCDDGCEIPVGTLTLGTGHASLSDNHREAASHYDNTGTAVADLAVGEDEFGIWVAGAQRPNLPDEVLRAARGSAPSGDWRRIGGNLELVAVLAVNVPGFPVPRARVAAGQQVALVAAAAPEVLDPAEVRLRALEARLQTLESCFELSAAGTVLALDDRVLNPLDEFRDFPAAARKAAAKSGAAMPDGGFPIKTVADLKNAIQAIGRAKDPAAAKAHIVKCARALGATDQLPKGWA